MGSNMTKKIYSAKISISGFSEDPSNDAALRINGDIRGAGDYYATVYVYFSDRFIEEYFQIAWHNELASEEHRIIKEKFRLFATWAVAKIEEYLRGQIKKQRIFIDYPTDMIWAG